MGQARCKVKTTGNINFPGQNCTPEQYNQMHFLFLYLSVDLARIQQVVPGLSSIRPGVIVTLLLLFFLLRSGRAGMAFYYPQIKRIVGFVLLLFIYIPFADGANAAYKAALGMLLFLPFIFSCVVLIVSKDHLLKLCKIYALILLFVCGYALAHGGRGPGGSIADENDLCLFVVCFLPLIFFILGQESGKNMKLFWQLVITVSLSTIVSTFSRGGFVGMVVMGTVYWWFSTRKVLIFALILVVGVGILYFSGKEYKQEMETVTDTHQNTASERILSWQAAWDMFLDRPWGVGGNNFPRLFPEYQSEKFTRNMWGRAAHSLWFTLMPETGIIGILLYFSIIRINIKNVFQIRRYENYGCSEDKRFFDSISLALLSSFAGFFAAGSFISVLYYPIFWYLTTLVVCVNNIHSEFINQDNNEGICV